MEALGKVIDTRAAVGRLSRNIKIISGGDSSWGFRLFTYHDSKCTRTGSVKLNSVELINGGQGGEPAV